MQENPRLPCYDFFMDSWLAVGYRFITCTEHDIRFRNFIQSPNYDRPQANHYFQERELFGFFVSGLASLECIYFSCYILAATLDGKNFPFSNQRFITIETTTRKFAKYYSSDKLCVIMERISNESDFTNWKDIRNNQTHRMMSSQHNQVTLSPPQPPGTMPRITWIAGSNILDINSTISYRLWLTTKLNDFFDGISEFINKYF